MHDKKTPTSYKEEPCVTFVCVFAKTFRGKIALMVGLNGYRAFIRRWLSWAYLQMDASN